MRRTVIDQSKKVVLQKPEVDEHKEGASDAIMSEPIQQPNLRHLHMDNCLLSKIDPELHRLILQLCQPLEESKFVAANGNIRVLFGHLRSSNFAWMDRLAVLGHFRILLEGSEIDFVLLELLCLFLQCLVPRPGHPARILFDMETRLIELKLNTFPHAEYPMYAIWTLPNSRRGIVKLLKEFNSSSFDSLCFQGRPLAQVNAFSVKLIKFPNLLHLDMSCCQLSDVSTCETFSKHLSHVSKLQHLILSDCGFTDDTMSILCTGLTYLPALEKLDLSHNRFNDLGIVRLAKIFHKITRLQYLDLAGNYFTSASREMCNYLHNLKDLVEVILPRIPRSTNVVFHDMHNMVAKLYPAIHSPDMCLLRCGFTQCKLYLSSVVVETPIRAAASTFVTLDKHKTSVSSLVIHHLVFDPENLSIWGEAVVSMPLLTSLRLVKAVFFGEKFQKELASIIGQLTSLRVLELRDFKFVHMLRHLKRLTQLTDLSLCEMGIDKECRLFLEILATMTHLRRLNLGCDSLSWSQITTLIEVMGQLEHKYVRELVIPETTLTSANMKNLEQQAKKYPLLILTFTAGVPNVRDVSSGAL